MADLLQKQKPFSIGITVIGLSALAVIAKAAGFAEKIVIARFFGTDESADVYFAATGVVFSIVFLIKELVYPTFLPVMAKALKQDQASSTALFRRFILLSSVVIVCLCSAMALFSDQVTTLFVPGFSSEKKMQMSFLLRYLAPACLFLCLSMIVYTALNAFKRFLKAAVPETAYKFVVLAGLVCLIPLFGLKAVPMVLSVAAMALFVSMLFCIPKQHAMHGPRVSPSKDLAAVFGLMGPIAIGVIFSHISGLVDNMLASTLPTGHLAYLNYSKKLIDAILLIGPVALTTVSYSHLAGLAAQSPREYAGMFVKILRILIYISIPCIILIVCLRESVIRILFEGGKFNAVSTAGTSRALMVYGFGFLAFALDAHIVNSFYAVSDTRTPVCVGIGCVILDVCLAVSMISMMGYVAIALALVISKYVKVLVLAYLLEKRFRFMESSVLIPFLYKTILAAVPSTLLLVYLGRFNLDGHMLHKALVNLLLPATGFAVVFCSLSVLFGIKESQEVVGMLLCRLGYKKKLC